MKDTFNPAKVPLKNKFFASLLETLLGLKPLIKCYKQRPIDTAGKDVQGKGFLQHVLKYLNVTTTVKNEHFLQQIPKEGATVFVSNHPLGGLEGVAMTEFLLDYRPDTLVLTNELLTRIPQLQSLFIGVDILSGNSAQKNSKTMRIIYQHLANGGALLVYPAGVVSRLNTQNWEIEDPDWKNFVGRLIKKYEATTIPFFVKGKNSFLFYLLGLIHKRIRTLMLARQLANKKNFELKINVGEPIEFSELQTLENASAITHYLRVVTNFLAIENNVGKKKLFERQLTNPEKHNIEQNAADIKNMEEFLLVRKQGFSVYCAPYDSLNSIMDEIAYARESTFRSVGEGTGLERDTDDFDRYYLHLFLWDDEKQCLVGGYRVGRTDEIVARGGVAALYSRTLYAYDESYIEKVGKSLEMGRSFITKEYQRHPRALDMLWRGIGSYVVKNPEYHTLFGSVSTSDEHSELAKAFLSDAMMQHFRAQPKYTTGIKPVFPIKIKNKVWTTESLSALSSLTIMNKLIGKFDPGKSIPVLLRQYLTLNGKFVCFSTNRGFNDSLDGFIVVDLRKTPNKYLKRYLGKEGRQTFLKKWEENETTV